jgi:hypothetical protein
MVDESVIEGVRNYLQALEAHGIAVSFGVVFGSQAAGKAGLWSDIDLLVVSPQFDHQQGRAAVDWLWRIAARTDSRIEPIPCGEKQWQEDDSSEIVEIARRDGMPIRVRE